MKVGIVSVQVPFIRGGAEFLAESLRDELVQRGIEADIISIPFKWYPPERILDSMLCARLLDLEEVNGERIDRLVVLKFPAYFVRHPCKVGWLLHQHRQAYDLYETEHGDLHDSEKGRQVAAEIRAWDNALLPELDSLFVISKTVAERLRTFNELESEPLYPPPGGIDEFRCEEFDDFVLCAGRIDPLKRQHLVVEAMKTARDNLKLVLIGQYDNEYGRDLVRSIAQSGLQDRVRVLGRVSNAEKLDLYARCLGVYNGVYDEDYGYTTIEAFFAGKPVVTHTDAGGPCEFVSDGENGFVVPPTPPDVVEAFARLAEDPSRARRMGASGRELVSLLHISWDYTIERLLS